MSHTKSCPPVRLAGYVRLSTLALLLFASAALAQPEGLPKFELERLELNPNGRGSLVMGTGELLPAGGFRLSLLGHYERDPLVLYANGNRVGAVVEDRVMAHLLAAWAPLRWLELDLQLPLVVWQRGDDLSAQGIGAPARTGLSTPLVHARVGLLSQRREAPVDLALELGAGIPVGSVDTLSRESTFRFSPKVMVGRRFGLLRAGLEAGALIRPKVTLIEDQEIQDEVGSEVRLGAVVATTGTGLRGELNVRGTLPLTQQPKSLELLAGVRLPLGPTVEAYALGGPGFGHSPGTPSFRVLLGVAFGTPEPPDPSQMDDGGDGVKNGVDKCPQQAGPARNKGCPVKDSDGDGVEDSEDKCPNEPGPAARQGCPLKDSDGDGVEDSADKCPNEAGPLENQGCPVKDRDGDGITDAQDKCPNEPGPAARQGCPVKDSDGDGVVDDRDACPTQAGLVELRGCPPKDTDGDGVPDHLDNCPNEKGVASNQGCPPQQEQLVVIQKGRLEIKEAVFFTTGKATIRPRSFRMLDQIARVIKEHPEIEKIIVEGHTDNVGDPEFNRKLSLARAESVRDYLVKKGVEPARLEARGYGPDRPLLSNETAKGRAANRRVMFTIVSPDSGQ